MVPALSRFTEEERDGHSGPSILPFTSWPVSDEVEDGPGEPICRAPPPILYLLQTLSSSTSVLLGEICWATSGRVTSLVRMDQLLFRGSWAMTGCLFFSPFSGRAGRGEREVSGRARARLPGLARRASDDRFSVASHLFLGAGSKVSFKGKVKYCGSGHGNLLQRCHPETRSPSLPQASPGPAVRVCLRLAHSPASCPP